MNKYKIIFDNGKPYTDYANSEEELKVKLKDFYVNNKSGLSETYYYDVEVFDCEDEDNEKDISESQFIQEMISEIIEEEEKERLSKFIDYDIKDVIGFEPSEHDSSVNYYSPNCLIFKTDKTQLQLYISDDNLLSLMDLLEPLIERRKRDVQDEEVTK